MKKVREKYGEKMAADNQLDILDEIEYGCEKIK
jgi:hypothetical protein